MAVYFIRQQSLINGFPGSVDTDADADDDDDSGRSEYWILLVYFSFWVTYFTVYWFYIGCCLVNAFSKRF